MRTFRIVVGLPIALLGVAVCLLGVFIADGYAHASGGFREIGDFIDDVCKGTRP